MVHPHTGEDWRAHGPLLELSFGSASEKNVGIVWWDGQLGLPVELDTAVVATLEPPCSEFTGKIIAPPAPHG